ncbi:peptidylprolyl isomerase [Dankookia sp. P2]|uniref:peptidylprolyl isomerase n=1 Tax=Dankookia sp. P2 TaxID=3423955 RepID=UPI003D675AF4
MTNAAGTPAPGNTLILGLKDGPVTIELLPDVAPKHVEQIKLLVGRGFYDGTPFHRVIEGFMAQGGDPTGTGTGGARDLPDLPAEFNKVSFQRGVCGMARSQSPNSANSQFFICFGDASFLDGQYTVWGRVTDGMDVVDKIKRGAPGSGTVNGPDKLIRASIA